MACKQFYLGPLHLKSPRLLSGLFFPYDFTIGTQVSGSEKESKLRGTGICQQRWTRTGSEGIPQSNASSLFAADPAYLEQITYCSACRTWS